MDELEKTLRAQYIGASDDQIWWLMRGTEIGAKLEREACAELVTERCGRLEGSIVAKAIRARGEK